MARFKLDDGNHQLAFARILPQPLFLLVLRLVLGPCRQLVEERGGAQQVAKPHGAFAGGHATAGRHPLQRIEHEGGKDCGRIDEQRLRPENIEHERGK